MNIKALGQQMQKRVVIFCLGFHSATLDQVVHRSWVAYGLCSHGKETRKIKSKSASPTTSPKRKKKKGKQSFLTIKRHRVQSKAKRPIDPILLHIVQNACRAQDLFPNHEPSHLDHICVQHALDFRLGDRFNLPGHVRLLDKGGGFGRVEEPVRFL